MAKFVSRDDPSASPLLVKAVTAHGGQRAPAFYNQSHPAYRNLELWAHWAAGPEGSPMPEAVPVRKPTRARVGTSRQPPTTADGRTASARRAKSDDPYDPSVFNRAMQPGR